LRLTLVLSVLVSACTMAMPTEPVTVRATMLASVAVVVPDRRLRQPPRPPRS
jgi:hypothetical protein